MGELEEVKALSLYIGRCKLGPRFADYITQVFTKDESRDLQSSTPPLNIEQVRAAAQSEIQKVQLIQKQRLLQLHKMLLRFVSGEAIDDVSKNSKMEQQVCWKGHAHNGNGASRGAARADKCRSAQN